MNEKPDYLDDLLVHGAPRDVIVTPAIEDELARMIVAARSYHGRRNSARRHLSRAATVGISTAIVLAAAGAAAAAVTLGPWNSQWAEDPVATMTYTVPSGESCERRFGAIAGEDLAMKAAVEHFLASSNLADVIDIDAAIRSLRADTDSTRTGEDGKQIDTGYGTSNYFTPDEEYQQAVTRALTVAVMADLEQRGLGTDLAQWTGLSFEGETKCTGDQR